MSSTGENEVHSEWAATRDHPRPTPHTVGSPPRASRARPQGHGPRPLTQAQRSAPGTRLSGGEGPGRPAQMPVQRRRSTRPAPAALPTYSGASGVRAQVRPSPAAQQSSARPPGNRRCRRRHRPPLWAQRAEARLRHTPSTVRGRPRALRPWRPGIGRPVRHSRTTTLFIG